MRSRKQYATLLCCAVPFAAHALGQTARPVTFTGAQAERGHTLYRDACVQCHGSDLGGFGPVPPLNDSSFLEKYLDKSALTLFDVIQQSMPADKPGSLSRAEATDVMTYLLRSNSFTEGAEELPATAAALGTFILRKPAAAKP